MATIAPRGDNWPELSDAACTRHHGQCAYIGTEADRCPLCHATSAAIEVTDYHSCAQAAIWGGHRVAQNVGWHGHIGLWPVRRILRQAWAPHSGQVGWHEADHQRCLSPCLRAPTCQR